jgi:hypothetical protein
MLQSTAQDVVVTLVRLYQIILSCCELIEGYTISAIHELSPIRNPDGPRYNEEVPIDMRQIAQYV